MFRSIGVKLLAAFRTIFCQSNIVGVKCHFVVRSIETIDEKVKIDKIKWIENVSPRAN